MTQGPLSADDIRRLFGELASELDTAGQRAEIFLVGGAAIALCFDARRLREAPGLLVDVASAEYLLAMKLFSSRVETDAEDIALLYREVGYHTVEEGLALVERSYPGRPIAARMQFLLEEIVQSLDSE
jgi:hypothetical protein